MKRDFLVGHSFLLTVFGHKDVRGKRETLLREFFLRGLPAKESELSLAEHQRRGANLQALERSA